MDFEKMQRKRNFWFGTAMLLLGVTIGYLVAPAKKGVNIKNICGNGWAADECIDADNCFCDDDDDENCVNNEDISF